MRVFTLCVCEKFQWVSIYFDQFICSHYGLENLFHMKVKRDFKRHLFVGRQKKAIELCFSYLNRKVQTNKLQADAKIQAVLDYFKGLIQRKNKRLILLDKLVSLEARTL